METEIKDNQKSKKGLDGSNKKLIVAIFVIVLLIWGPIEPYGLIVRTAYLLILPSALILILNYFGARWGGGKEENDRLNRAIIGIIAGAFFIGAYLSCTSAHHFKCTQEVRTKDGLECVGDYVPVKGPDISGAVILAALGSFAFWSAAFRRKDC